MFVADLDGPKANLNHPCVFHSERFSGQRIGDEHATHPAQGSWFDVG
jgi:hypothetical protein